MDKEIQEYIEEIKDIAASNVFYYNFGQAEKEVVKKVFKALDKVKKEITQEVTHESKF